MNKTKFQYHITGLIINGKETLRDLEQLQKIMANALRNASGGTDAQKFKDLENYNINTQAPVQ